MKLGFHLSIGGGLLKAVAQGIRTGCEAAQIFSRNPRGWAAKPLEQASAVEFGRARRDAGLEPLAVHLPYLPNLASEKDDLYEKSVSSLADELLRSESLGAEYVVAHPGHVGRDFPLAAALERVASGVVRAFKAAGPDLRVRLLLENTSGQRGEVGSDLAELGDLAAAVESALPGAGVGFCLDTAHAWAAGYDLRSPSGQERVLAEVDRLLKLDRVCLVHLNDSLSELGGRRDRHAAVGLGLIGSRGMARLVRHEAFAHLAGIMETPRQTEADDLANMARAKSWRSA